MKIEQTAKHFRYNTLGKFGFYYICTVERHWHSQWRTHRGCKEKRKFTHSVDRYIWGYTYLEPRVRWISFHDRLREDYRIQVPQNSNNTMFKSIRDVPNCWWHTDGMGNCLRTALICLMHKSASGKSLGTVHPNLNTSHIHLLWSKVWGTRLNAALIHLRRAKVQGTHLNAARIHLRWAKV